MAELKNAYIDTGVDSVHINLDRGQCSVGNKLVHIRDVTRVSGCSCFACQHSLYPGRFQIQQVYSVASFFKLSSLSFTVECRSYLN